MEVDRRGMRPVQAGGPKEKVYGWRKSFKLESAGNIYKANANKHSAFSVRV